MQPQAKGHLEPPELEEARQDPLGEGVLSSRHLNFRLLAAGDSGENISIVLSPQLGSFVTAAAGSSYCPLESLCVPPVIYFKIKQHLPPARDCITKA